MIQLIRVEVDMGYISEEREYRSFVKFKSGRPVLGSSVYIRTILYMDT